MSNQELPTAIIHLGETRHIEPGKTYSIEIEHLGPLHAEEIKNIIRTFEEATGAKAVLVQGAKVKDLGCVTITQRIRTIIAQMKSNQDSHKNYILQLEEALDGDDNE